MVELGELAYLPKIVSGENSNVISVLHIKDYQPFEFAEIVVKENVHERVYSHADDNFWFNWDFRLVSGEEKVKLWVPVLGLNDNFLIYLKSVPQVEAESFRLRHDFVRAINIESILFYQSLVNLSEV